MLCINGDVLDSISTNKDIGKILKSVHVFSRTSPNQKDFIVGMLNKEGHVTMMCGDGTNDVGSLKELISAWLLSITRSLLRKTRKRERQCRCG